MRRQRPRGPRGIEHEFGEWFKKQNSAKRLDHLIILRAKAGGFHDLRYTRIESTSADCSARLADYTDTEGEVENLD